MTTKKILVPIDLENPEKNINDFLYPTKFKGKFVFKGIKTGKTWKNGIVSFVGINLTKNEIFAKIIDSGTKIDNVNNLLLYLENYIEQVKNISLGTVTQIEHENESFIFKSLGKKPKIKRNRLP